MGGAEWPKMRPDDFLTRSRLQLRKQLRKRSLHSVSAEWPPFTLQSTRIGWGAFNFLLLLGQIIFNLVARMSELDWHDTGCRRPDLVELDGFVSCKACGSIRDVVLEQPVVGDQDGTVSDDATTPPTGGSVVSGSAFDTATYVHSAIALESEIRLMELHPGDFDDDIRATIEAVDLKSIREEFDAISYTWADASGNATKTANILIVDGKIG